MVVSCKEKSDLKALLNEKDSIALKNKLEEVFIKNELVGMSVLVLSDGKIAWHSAFGKANMSQHIPITENTIYRVASISKTIIAIAIMQLWEDGKVDLDTDISNYLGWSLRNPKFPDIPITLKQLLSHQSGIRDGEGYQRFSNDMISEKLDIRELFLSNGSYFTDDQFADHSPGDYFSYANCSWGIIASVIEKVSQQRLDNYCRKEIFKPMALKADFNVANLTHLDSLAVLYTYDDEKWIAQADDYSDKLPQNRAFEGYELGQNGLLFGPQGSLRSSAKDLSAIAIMLMNDGTYNNNQILEKATVDFMLKSQWEYNGKNGDTWENFFLSYGIGIHQTTNTPNGDIIFPDRKMVGHPGIAYGLLSDMYLEKDKRSGIIFITNGSKNKFEYGEKSTFYQVEEDIFQTVFPYLKTIEQNAIPKN
jgi:CubicO group peptidase (beta-lactamase class C family)